jgi:hypothetical protein
MIDIENRLSLVSRAVISQSSLKGAKKSAERLFDSVWKDVTKMAGRKKSIPTLSRGIKNSILAVHKDKIVLRSELTKKKRTVMKEEFEHFWELLSRKKRLHFPHDIQDPAMVRAGSIIISFLARLPRVQHSIKPRVLYLTGQDTHSLGKLKAYA